MDRNHNSSILFIAKRERLHEDVWHLDKPLELPAPDVSFTGTNKRKFDLDAIGVGFGVVVIFLLLIVVCHVCTTVRKKLRNAVAVTQREVSSLNTPTYVPINVPVTCIETEELDPPPSYEDVMNDLRPIVPHCRNSNS